MTSPVILISDNLRSEKIDCACQVVEIDLLGSTQARSQFFSKGGAEVMEAKALTRTKLLVIRILKEST